MRPHHSLAAPLLFAAACVQSKHGEGPGSSTPSPGGKAHILEDRPGSGRPALPGDRIRVDFVGRYANGEIWGRGPLTLILGHASYPGAAHPIRVGSFIRMQYVVNPNDTTVRLVPFPGGDPESEAYQVRRDRGQIVEHRVLSVCRPMKLHIIQTGIGLIESELGCWPMLRAAPPPGDAPAQIDLDPRPVPRARADTAGYLDEFGLHRAAREGRPEIVGWLIARGRNPSAVDTAGFQPIHCVGWAQRPQQRFVPAFEQFYVDVVDTLLVHGADVNALTVRQTRTNPTFDPHEEGATSLGFAAPECADRLATRLLERGANPNVLRESGSAMITGAAINGCPEMVRLLLTHGARVDVDPQGGGTPLERLIAVSAFHAGHLEVARLLVQAGARTNIAIDRLSARLKDPGQGGFGFSNRPEARRILALLRSR